MPSELLSLAARLQSAPPLADAKRARARLADLLARVVETPQALCTAQAARHRAPSGMPREDVARAFRRARAEHALLVALADLGGVWSVEEVTAALTAFADASVVGGGGVALKEGEAQGRLPLCDPDDPGRDSGTVVLALGKHGAGELNYSSDIDLVVFFDPEAAPLAAGAEPATVFTRIAQAVARLLGERTADGYVHR